MANSRFRNLEIDLPDVDLQRNTEGDFLRDYFRVCNEVRCYLKKFATLTPSESLDKQQQGILLGHIVRLYKLYDSYIFLIEENRKEIAMILIRLIAETLINLKYLIKERDNLKLFKKFTNAALALDKKIYNEVDKRKKQSPFSANRVQKSINNAFERIGFTFKEVIWNDRRWANDLFKLSNDLGMQFEYEFMFRAFCHTVHGTWRDLESQHLIEEDRYKPKLDYSNANCKLFEDPSISVLEIGKEYAVQICNCHNTILIRNTDSMIDWFDRMSVKLEEFLKLGK